MKTEIERDMRRSEFFTYGKTRRKDGFSNFKTDRKWGFLKIDFSSV